MDVYSAGTLKVSKRICAAVSRFCRGFSGASVIRTGCCDRVVSPCPATIILPHQPPNATQTTHLLAQDFQLIRINMLPNPLHILPIRHNPMLQRIPQLQQSPQLLCPVANKRVPLQSSCQHPCVFWAADVGGEEAFGEVFAGVARADGAGAVVDYYGGIVEVGHGGWCVGEGGRVVRALGSAESGLQCILGVKLVGRREVALPRLTRASRRASCAHIARRDSVWDLTWTPYSAVMTY